MRFARPELLHLLWVVPVLAALALWSLRSRSRRLRRLADSSLIRALAPRRSPGRRLLRVGLLLGAIMFLCLAAAQPQWGLVEEEVSRVGVDVVIAVDTSLSMLARDVRPSRLERARAELRSFLERLGGDRLALVVFSSSAHILVPLTLDVGVIDMFLGVMDTEITSGRGTALSEAIEEALGAFPEEDQGPHRVIVLVTDGEDHGAGDPLAAARRAADAGVVIHTVGVGTEQGEPIPVRDPFGQGGITYKTDREGSVVTSRLDEETLQTLASTTGGTYRRLGAGGGSLEEVYEEIQRMEKRALEDRMGRRMRDRFQWPLAAGILLLLARVALPEGRRDRRETPRRS